MNNLPTNNSIALVNELKHLMLSIDKGITDNSNKRIIYITDQLGSQWQNDKILSPFVKMTRALFDYAASRKNNIHPDTVSFINSLVQNIDKLSSPSGSKLPLSQKQSILGEEIAKYNILKKNIKSGSQESSSGDLYGMDNSIVISELKSVILSLDWEITDELIRKLDTEINKLHQHWQNSKIHLSFLQMFKSIGGYVMSKGANTHPDSITLLHSLYKNFEYIVLTPSMPDAEQKDILMSEMKKFNDLKQIISSAKKPKNIPPARPAAISPMDDLIGTKSSSNLSPVDELIEEIHMLQDSGTRTHSLDAKVSQGSTPSAPSNPEVKEVVPNRHSKEPIPEIMTRLDAFFDEDEPLSDLSFADSGEEVVPYKGESTSTGYQEPAEYAQPESLKSNYAQTSNKKLSFDKNLKEDDQEIILEEETLYDEDISFEDDDSSLNMQDISFEEEFFEEQDIIEEKKPKNQKPEDQKQIIRKSDNFVENKAPAHKSASLSYPKIEEMKDKDIAILEELKSNLGKSLLHASINEIKDIPQKLTLLEQSWADYPEKVILLKMVKSLAGYFDIMSNMPTEQTLELMLYIVESMENSREELRGTISSGATGNPKESKISNKSDIIEIFSKYVDFQNKIAVSRQSIKTTQPETSADDNNQVETLAEQEMYSISLVEASDIEQQLTEPKGLWAKIKKWLGF